MAFFVFIYLFLHVFLLSVLSSFHVIIFFYFFDGVLTSSIFGSRAKRSFARLLYEACAVFFLCKSRIFVAVTIYVCPHHRLFVTVLPFC